MLGLLLLLVAASCQTPQSAAAGAKIGILRSVPASDDPPAFLDTLAAAGFVVGQTLHLDGRDAFVPDTSTPEARRLVAGWETAGVELIVALSTSTAKLAAAHAPSARIIFMSNDPSALGLVENEHAPEGRLTGVSFRVPADRTLDFARRVGAVDRIGILRASSDPAAAPHYQAITSAAERLGLTIVDAPWQDGGLESAVEGLARADVRIAVVSNSPAAIRAIRQTEEAAVRHRIALVANTTFARSAVVVVEPDVGQLLEQIGMQAIRLLSGTEPHDVPVEDPRRFRVIVNTSAAGDLGLTVPSEVLLEADEVVTPDGARP